MFSNRLLWKEQDPCLLRMLLLSLLFTVLSLARCDSASVELCKAELNSVLADPWTYSEGYLYQISEKLKVFSGLLFTPQVDSVIANFEQEFGVNVELQQSFPACSTQAPSICNAVNNTYDAGSGSISTFGTNFSIEVLDSGSLTTASFSIIEGTVGGSKAILAVDQFINMTLISPSGLSVPILESTCTVAPDTNFNFGLVDTSPIPFSCSDINATLSLAFTPTNLFNTFAGQEVYGNWTLNAVAGDVAYFLTLFFNYCYEDPNFVPQPCSYTSDMSRSNLNIPGYRYDAGTGMAYFTTLIRNCQGQEMYATISRSVANMIIKK